MGERLPERRTSLGKGPEAGKSLATVFLRNSKD